MSLQNEDGTNAAQSQVELSSLGDITTTPINQHCAWCRAPISGETVIRQTVMGALCNKCYYEIAPAPTPIATRPRKRSK